MPSISLDHPQAATAGASSTSASQLTIAQALKLKKAGAEFESMLLANWWKSMKESGIGEEESTDPGHDTLDQMGIQALCSAVASGGGLGIGAMLVRGLLSNAAHNGTLHPEPAKPGTPALGQSQPSAEAASTV